MASKVWSGVVVVWVALPGFRRLPEFQKRSKFHMLAVTKINQHSLWRSGGVGQVQADAVSLAEIITMGRIWGLCNDESVCCGFVQTAWQQPRSAAIDQGPAPSGACRADRGGPPASADGQRQKVS